MRSFKSKYVSNNYRWRKYFINLHHLAHLDEDVEHDKIGLRIIQDRFHHWAVVLKRVLIEKKRLCILISFYSDFSLISFEIFDNCIFPNLIWCAIELLWKVPLVVWAEAGWGKISAFVYFHEK